MWQYTCGGTVLGIDALVDINLLFIYNDDEDAH
jgi:GH25 family lysozyme M1 (1,4-beta-N-acetylmuramidase)